MRRSATVRPDNICLGRALMRDSGKHYLDEFVNSQDAYICKKAKTMVPITSTYTCDNLKISTDELINRLNDSEKMLFNNNYMSLLDRFTESENSIFMALIRNAHMIESDELLKTALDVVLAQLPDTKASLFISSLNIQNDDIYMDLVKRAFEHKSYEIMTTLLNINQEKTVNCLAQMRLANRTIEFWILLDMHFHNVPKLSQIIQFIDHLCTLSNDPEAMVIALCFGDHGRKAFNGFLWLSDQLFTTAKIQSRKELPRCISNLIETKDIVKDDILEIVTALPDQCIKFVEYMINDVHHTRKYSNWEYVFDFLIKIIELLISLNKNIISIIIDLAFKPNSKAMKLLCKLLSNQKCIGRTKAILEENIIPRFKQIHLLDSSNELLDSLPLFLKVSSKARYMLFQSLLNYSQSPKTVPLTMNGLLMLLSNERLASASILAKCASQASQMVAMSQPASQKHLHICATSLDLLRRNLKFVQSNIHMLVRQNRRAVSVPLLAILIDHLLSSGENQDLYACCLRCIAECVNDLIEENSDQIIFFRNKLIEALKISLKLKPTIDQSNIVEHNVISSQIGGTSIEYDATQLVIPIFATELAAKVFLKAVDDSTYSTYSKSYMQKTILKNLNWDQFRNDVCNISIEKLKHWDDCDDWKWWLLAGSETKIVRSPPSYILENMKVLEEPEVLRCLLTWALTCAYVLDSSWITYVEKAITRLVCEPKRYKGKVLEIALHLYCVLSDEPFEMIKIKLVSITDMNTIDTISRCLSKMVQVMTDECELFRQIDKQFVIILEPLIQSICYISDQEIVNMSGCHRIANLLNQLYELLVKLMKHNVDESIIVHMMSLLGMDGLQKSSTQFINRAQSLDNTMEPTKKLIQSLSNVIPKLVHNSDVLEYTLLQNTDDPELMKKYFKLSACRDFRINKREFQMLKEKISANATTSYEEVVKP